MLLVFFYTIQNSIFGDRRGIIKGSEVNLLSNESVVARGMEAYVCSRFKGAPSVSGNGLA